MAEDRYNLRYTGQQIDQYLGKAAACGAVSEYDKVKYTAPTGSGSATFEGTAFNVSVSGTPTGEIGITSSGDGTSYTPTGTVACPTLNVIPTSDTESTFVASSADGGGSVTAGSAASFTTEPSLSYSIGTGADAETLTITFDKGVFNGGSPTSVTLPTFSQKTVVTAVDVTAGTPQNVNLSGDAVRFSFSGDSLTSTGQNTATGNITNVTVGVDANSYATLEKNGL